MIVQQRQHVRVEMDKFFKLLRRVCSCRFPVPLFYWSDPSLTMAAWCRVVLAKDSLILNRSITVQESVIRFKYFLLQYYKVFLYFSILFFNKLNGMISYRKDFLD
jgi:hypothetical protein